MKNGKCWLSVRNLIMVICCIMKYISITLKYHIIICMCSWYQVEQAHCTSVLHIFWRQVNPHLVPVCHPTVLHAGMEIGKRLARFVSECMSQLRSQLTSNSPEHFDINLRTYILYVCKYACNSTGLVYTSIARAK